MLAASLVGCGSFTNASSNSVSDFATSDFLNAPSQCVIDAGILFADEASYVCVPLSRLGIADSDELLSVQSSCECVRPSLVYFDKFLGNTARAMRIDFRPGGTNADSKHTPSNLAIEVTIKLANGKDKSASIRFLQTAQASEN